MSSTKNMDHIWETAVPIALASYLDISMVFRLVLYCYQEYYWIDDTVNRNRGEARPLQQGGLEAEVLYSL